MRILLSSGKKRHFAATILNHPPNGDWRNREFIEYLPRPSDDPEAVKRNISIALTAVLFSSNIREWPRHRWTGSDLIASQIGLLDAAHGLLEPTFKLFVSLTNKKPYLVACGVGVAGFCLLWQGAPTAEGSRDRPFGPSRSWKLDQ